MDNYMKLEFPSKSCNEAFARAAVGAFATQLDLTIEDLADIKTAVSEAVTNSIVHGYAKQKGVVEVQCRITGSVFEVEVCDTGCGITDVEEAMQPLYTTMPDDERSGMGFTVMQSFMDKLTVESMPGEGTRIHMTKVIGEDGHE